MQSVKRSDLPEDVQKEVEGYNFVILSAGKWPKVLDKDISPIALGARAKNISLTKEIHHPETGQKVSVEKAHHELSSEIGNVDLPGCEMFRLDD